MKCVHESSAAAKDIHLLGQKLNVVGVPVPVPALIVRVRLEYDKMNNFDSLGLK